MSFAPQSPAFRYRCRGPSVRPPRADMDLHPPARCARRHCCRWVHSRSARERDLLECRTNIKWLTLRRDNGCKEPLTVPPANVGEVQQRRAANHEDCVQLVITHKLTRAVQPLTALVNRNRP